MHEIQRSPHPHKRSWWHCCTRRHNQFTACRYSLPSRTKAQSKHDECTYMRLATVSRLRMNCTVVAPTTSVKTDLTIQHLSECVVNCERLTCKAKNRLGGRHNGELGHLARRACSWQTRLACASHWSPSFQNALSWRLNLDAPRASELAVRLNHTGNKLYKGRGSLGR